MKTSFFIDNKCLRIHLKVSAPHQSLKGSKKLLNITAKVSIERHCDNTYKDFTYNNFTYKINK
jgi:hypothetical protein